MRYSTDYCINMLLMGYIVQIDLLTSRLDEVQRRLEEVSNYSKGTHLITLTITSLTLNKCKFMHNVQVKYSINIGYAMKPRGL